MCVQNSACWIKLPYLLLLMLMVAVLFEDVAGKKEAVC